jgi:hypothetical protein
MGVKPGGRHNMERSTNETARDAEHKAEMLSGLRQAWVYRDRNNIAPRDVWLMVITCWWGEKEKVTVKYCAGEFAGRKDGVKDPYSNEGLEEVLNETDLDNDEVLWGEHTH